MGNTIESKDIIREIEFLSDEDLIYLHFMVEEEIKRRTSSNGGVSIQ